MGKLKDSLIDNIVFVDDSQPQRKPLTEEEIKRIRIEQFDNWKISESAFGYIARAIEAAHGIKENT